MIKTTVLLKFCNTRSVRLDPQKKRGKEKLTIYAQRLPIIISYLNIPIQRQSELAKAPKWPVSQKQLPSSLPANANLPVIFFST
jgi:hypothetical protein